MENVDKEILKMLENDLYIAESEEVEKENINLRTENEVLKQDAENKEIENQEFLEDIETYLIDTEQLIEYLSDTGTLTEDLKNQIEYFAKFINSCNYC